MSTLSRILGFNRTRFCAVHSSVVLARVKLNGSTSYCCPACANEQY